MIIPFEPNLFFRYIFIFRWTDQKGWGKVLVQTSGPNRDATVLENWEVGQEMGGN